MDEKATGAADSVRRRRGGGFPWRVALGISLSLALLLATFWNANLAELWGVLANAEPGYIALGFVLSFTGLFLRAYRWRLLFPPGRLPYGDFLDAVNLGYLVNNLAPVRFGDLVRSVLLGRWLGTGVGLALSATVVERALDAALMLMLFFGLLVVLPIPTAAANVGLVAALVVAAALAFMVTAAGQQARGERWLRRLMGWMPWFSADAWVPRFLDLVKGFQALRETGTLLRFTAWSGLLWAQAILTYWVIMLAFAPGLPVTYAALAIVGASFGLAAPSAPAGVGTFEGAVTGALLLVGIGGAQARSMAIALHAITFLVLVFAGLWSLTRRGLGYREVLAVGSSTGEAADGTGS